VAAAVPFAACAASEPHHIPILLSGSDRWHSVVFLFSQGGGGGRSAPGRSRHSLVRSFSTRVFPAVHVPGTSSNFLSSLISPPPPLLFHFFPVLVGWSVSHSAQVAKMKVSGTN